MDKPLSAFGLGDGGVLSCDDFLQNYTLRVGLIESYGVKMKHFWHQAYLWQMTEKPEDGSDFIVTGDKDKLQPKEAEEEKKEEVKANEYNFL